MEVDCILSRDSSVLGFALDVDNLILGKTKSSKNRIPDQKTEPGLALLLALPHPALVQPVQVHQEHVVQGGGGDLTPSGLLGGGDFL